MCFEYVWYGLLVLVSCGQFGVVFMCGIVCVIVVMGEIGLVQLVQIVIKVFVDDECDYGFKFGFFVFVECCDYIFGSWVFGCVVIEVYDLVKVL